MSGGERSEASFDLIIQNGLGLTNSEYRRLLFLSLVKRQVMAAMDEAATAEAARAAEAVAAADGDLNKGVSDITTFNDSGGAVSPENLDGGRARVAWGLEVGEVSEPFLSRTGDAYFIVKTTAKTGSTVSYESLRIPLTAFNDFLQELRDNGRIHEFIRLES